jgi:hypothetical protein
MRQGYRHGSVWKTAIGGAGDPEAMAATKVNKVHSRGRQEQINVRLLKRVRRKRPVVSSVSLEQQAAATAARPCDTH